MNIIIEKNLESIQRIICSIYPMSMGTPLDVYYLYILESILWYGHDDDICLTTATDYNTVVVQSVVAIVL